MTNKNDTNTTDEDLDGFEPMESAFDDAPETDADGDDHVDDADFQDISDDIDADVFGEGQPADEAPKKKGVNWFNIGVAGVAVLVAGGLIFMKLAPSLLGGGGNAETPAAVAGPDAVPANTDTGANAAAQQALQPQTQAVTGPGLLNNPDQYATLNQVPAGSVTEAKATPASDPFASLGGTPALVAPAATPEQAPTSAIVPMPTPISGSGDAAPDTSAITKDASTTTPVTTPVGTNTGAAVLDTAPVVGSVPAAGSNNATTAELKAQVSALQQKFEDLDSKVSSAVEKIGSATGSATPVDDARLSTIQTTLERLETRLDDLSSKRATTAVSAPRAATYDDAGPVIVRKAPVKKASRTNSTGNSKWDEPYAAGARPAAMTEGSKTTSPATGAGGWELRGAQNGRAIIAKAGDMREVGVGDNVPGLGEVMGIATMNGRWVVQGSKGRVSQ